MQHLVTIVPNPAPHRIGKYHEERAAKLLELWYKYIDSPRDIDGDYEDFFEQAVRLEAAIDGFGAENVWLRIGRHAETTARNLGTGAIRPLRELEHLPRYGMQEGQPGHTIELPQARLAGKYASYKAFTDRAGRRSVLAGFKTGDDQDLAVVLWKMYSEGVREFFVKTTTAKLGLWQFTAPNGLSPVQLEKLLLDQADWVIVRREGDRDFLQVQEVVKMEYEYRLFIVGGEDVSGAGCIEEFTPLNSDGGGYSNYVRRNRNSGGPYESPNRKIVDMLNLALRAIDALAEEVPELHSYVMDLAIGANGKPLIIELNDLLNSGLYASNPLAVTRALAQLTARGAQ